MTVEIERDNYELVHFDVSQGRLMLSVPKESVWVCDECPQIHVNLVEGEPDSIRTMAAGLLHLADHCETKH